MWRHLVCKTCSFCTRLRAADLQIGHGQSIIGRMSCLYSCTVSDGQATSHVKEGQARPISFSPGWRAPTRLAAYLGLPTIASCFDPLYCLSEKLHWPGLSDTSRGHGKDHSRALWDDDSDPPVPKPQLQSTEVGSLLCCGGALEGGFRAQRMCRSLYPLPRKVWCRNFNSCGTLLKSQITLASTIQSMWWFDGKEYHWKLTMMSSGQTWLQYY
jgi:hypothetical protein